MQFVYKPYINQIVGIRDKYKRIVFPFFFWPFCNCEMRFGYFRHFPLFFTCYYYCGKLKYEYSYGCA